ncbi:hypothetical protein GMI70_06930 [Eggerthellaceae bacterium zg-893]|nr:hypothetical protein [Eggerthellaceae bacterium zg-893]
MAALPTLAYARYAELGGRCSAEEFAASQRAAHAAVREIAGPNEIQDEEDLAGYERAVCAAVEVDRRYGASGGIGEHLASVTVGKVSMAMGSAGASPYDRDMAREVMRELAGTSLLYQGVR